MSNPNLRVQVAWTEVGPRFFSSEKGWGELQDADRVVNPDTLEVPESSYVVQSIGLEEAEALVDADFGGVSIWDGDFIY